MIFCIIYDIVNLCLQLRLEIMKKIDVLAYFGGVKKTADVLGIWPQAVYQWNDDIPELIAYKIEVITKGALKAGENNGRI